MEIGKYVNDLALKYCQQLEKVLNNMGKNPDLSAEELSKVNDSVRVLGNLVAMQNRGEL